MPAGAETGLRSDNRVACFGVNFLKPLRSDRFENSVFLFFFVIFIGLVCLNVKPYPRNYSYEFRFALSQHAVVSSPSGPVWWI